MPVPEGVQGVRTGNIIVQAPRDAGVRVIYAATLPALARIATVTTSLILTPTKRGVKVAVKYGTWEGMFRIAAGTIRTNTFERGNATDMRVIAIRMMMHAVTKRVIVSGTACVTQTGQTTRPWRQTVITGYGGRGYAWASSAENRVCSVWAYAMALTGTVMRMAGVSWIVLSLHPGAGTRGYGRIRIAEEQIPTSADPSTYVQTALPPASQEGVRYR